MSIKSICIMNVLGFYSPWRNPETDKMFFSNQTLQEESMYHFRDAFYMEFLGGVNVLIGENGVGKSSVLKMLYAAAQNSAEKTRGSLDVFFRPSGTGRNEFLNSQYSEGYSYFKVTDDNSNHFMEMFSPYLDESENVKIQYARGWNGLNLNSVFIPSTEMLSHSKGFLALNQKYEIPFDRTQIDIIANASLPEARAVSPVMQAIADKISASIDGTVVQENDVFYIRKTDGRKIEFSLEAEGLRKLGLLWKLVRNGLLEPGSILFWDEPESNLNPELFPVVAEILLELCKCNVQVFVATHSFNFAMYLELRRSQKEDVLFHNLYKEDKIISTQTAYRMDELKPNHIMMADDKLLDEVYDS